MSHHHSYDKIRLNAGTRGLVKLGKMAVLAAVGAAYLYCVSKVLPSYAHAREGSQIESRAEGERR
jgi:hypothetical protein